MPDGLQRPSQPSCSPGGLGCPPARAGWPRRRQVPGKVVYAADGRGSSLVWGEVTSSASRGDQLWWVLPSAPGVSQHGPPTPPRSRPGDAPPSGPPLAPAYQPAQVASALRPPRHPPTCTCAGLGTPESRAHTPRFGRQGLVAELEPTPPSASAHHQLHVLLPSLLSLPPGMPFLASPPSGSWPSPRTHCQPWLRACGLPCGPAGQGPA